MNPLARAWEEWCLEEFILAPASRRSYVDCIQITDGQVLDFAGVDDIGTASRLFAKALGPREFVNGALSGANLPLLKIHRPRFIRILVFTCWAQVTDLRSEQEFRGLLAERLGWEVPASLIGIRSMWEHLRDWLAFEWGIDLRLPEGPHRQIGYTLRLAFPTWRDMRGLRHVRDGMPRNALGHPRMVIERIKSLANDQDATPAFRNSLEEWEAAVRVGDPSADALPFAMVWRRVSAETRPDGSIQVVEDEYRDLRMGIVRTGGAFSEISNIGEAETAQLAPQYAGAARKGWQYLSPRGFGRCKSAEREHARAVLLRADKVDAAKSRPDITPRRVGDSGWSMMAVDDPIPADTSTTLVGEPSIRRIDGVRTGGAQLGRWPFTPRFWIRGPVEPTTDIDSRGVHLLRSGDELTFAPGTWRGKCRIELEGRTVDGFRMVADAVEHPDDYLRTFDAMTAISEDGPVFDTSPRVGPVTVRNRSQAGSEPDARMQALAEAVYARSARRLGMGEFVDLAARALAGADDAPRPWDVMRSFVDAGWFEPAAVRAAAARTFVPRKPCLRAAKENEKDLLVLDGLASEASRERVAGCAKASGAVYEVRNGVGPWSIPTLVIDAPTPTLRAELVTRTALTIEEDPAVRSPGSDTWATATTALGFRTISCWNKHEERFDGITTSTSESALRRLVRPDGDAPPIYLMRNRARDEIYDSPTLATLRFACMAGPSAPFKICDGLLVRRGSRVQLPAAWGRWLRLCALSSPGPAKIDGRWTYAYPIDGTGIEALSILCRVVDAGGRPHWQTALAASRRADLPLVGTPLGVLNPRLGSSR